MIWLSLVLNIAVLLPVCTALLRDTPAMAQAFGPDTPARRILLCLYGTILFASMGLIAAGLFGAETVAFATALLVGQVAYKMVTLAAVGFANPVVRANLVISAVHSSTLITVFIGES